MAIITFMIRIWGMKKSWKLRGPDDPNTYACSTDLRGQAAGPGQLFTEPRFYAYFDKCAYVHVFWQYFGPKCRIAQP